MKIFVSFFLVTIIGINIHAAELLDKANLYFKSEQFEKAIKTYDKCYNSSKDVQCGVGLAETYQKMGNYEMAIKTYSKVMAGDLEEKVDPEHYFRYAVCLYIVGEIVKSKLWFQRYDNIVGGGDNRVLKFLESANKRVELVQDSVFMDIEILNVNNTDADFAPTRYKDNALVYVSEVRNYAPKLYGKTMKIFVAEPYDTVSYELPFMIDGELNDGFNSGPLDFYDNFNRAILCQSDLDEELNNGVKNLNTKLSLYDCFLPNGIDDEMGYEKIPLFDANNTHPSITEDGNTLFFSSDADLGEGGMDIYVAYRTNGKWSEPKNLGAVINTKGTEVFPFIHNDSILYFASDGHGGLGGLDLYEVNINNLMPGSIRNLGAPLNSNRDDFGFYKDTNNVTGFFSSNRKGIGSDDIYRFEDLGVEIKGTIDSVPDFMFEKDSVLFIINGRDRQYVKTDSAGNFRLRLGPGDTFEILEPIHVAAMAKAFLEEKKAEARLYHDRSLKLSASNLGDIDSLIRSMFQADTSMEHQLDEMAKEIEDNIARLWASLNFGSYYDSLDSAVHYTLMQTDLSPAFKETRLYFIVEVIDEYGEVEEILIKREIPHTKVKYEVIEPEPVEVIEDVDEETAAEELELDFEVIL